jgi:hypothetical protein
MKGVQYAPPTELLRTGSVQRICRRPDARWTEARVGLDGALERLEREPAMPRRRPWVTPSCQRARRKRRGAYGDAHGRGSAQLGVNQHSRAHHNPPPCHREEEKKLICFNAGGFNNTMLDATRLRSGLLSQRCNLIFLASCPVQMSASLLQNQAQRKCRIFQSEVDRPPFPLENALFAASILPPPSSSRHFPFWCDAHRPITRSVDPA